MIDAAVLVVGAGAIGGVTAAKMTGAVRTLAVLDSNREHVERLREPGLLLDDLGEERRIRIDAYADPAQLQGRFDFALITLKATHLDAALRPLRERDAASCFVSLGNGLVQERIGDLVGEDRLIAGTVEWGSTNLGPGHLAQPTRAPFVIGELDGPPRERTELLARALETVADVRVTANIRGQIWSSSSSTASSPASAPWAGWCIGTWSPIRPAGASPTACGARDTTSASPRAWSSTRCWESRRTRSWCATSPISRVPRRPSAWS